MYLYGSLDVDKINSTSWEEHHEKSVQHKKNVTDLGENDIFIWINDYKEHKFKKTNNKFYPKANEKKEKRGFTSGSEKDRNDYWWQEL